MLLANWTANARPSHRWPSFASNATRLSWRGWRCCARSGIVLVGLTLLPASGCSSIGGPLAHWRLGVDDSLSPAPTDKETGDTRNFMARWLKPGKPPAGEFNPNPLVLGSNGWRPMKAESNPEADKEFREAYALFQQGKLTEAETAFAKLAKARKGSPWGEKGQFYLAETQFQRGKYVSAHDNFVILMKDYPGTEFNEKLVAREFAIAQTWLAQYDPKAPAEKKLPFSARFNGQEPLIDVRGHALQVLDHVRQHNPTGSLADDAVLRIADEHMSTNDYESAAMYYDQLISNHPKSPHLQRAQLAAIDARLKGYIGPEYNGEGLDKASELVKQTMASFPDRPAGNEKLYHILDLISDQKAEKAYVTAEYYKRAGYPQSAEYYFAKVAQKWPKSQWATKAKVELASLAKVPRKTHAPSKIMSQPGSNDPMFNNSGGGMMGGMGMPGMGMPGMGGMN